LGCYNEYHRLSGLNHRHVFLGVLEVEKYKIKMLTDVVLDEDPFSWPVAGQLLVGRKKKLWYFFPLEELLSHHDLSSPGPPKVPLPTSITLGANTSTYFFSFFISIY
jgi:hypothetical protein